MRTAELARIIIVSPEAVAAVLVAGAGIAIPEIFGKVGTYVVNDKPVIATTLLAIPFVLTAVSYKLGQEVLNPGDGRKVLIAWPGYWRLRLRIKVALSEMVICCLAFVIGWYLIQERLLAAGATCALCAIVVSAVVLVTVAQARLDVRDVLDGK